MLLHYNDIPPITKAAVQKIYKINFIAKTPQRWLDLIKKQWILPIDKIKLQECEEEMLPYILCED
jgi:hypothetical protein